MQVKIGTFTGTGASLSITGVGFQPDLALVKIPTASSDTWFRTKDMPATYSLPVRADGSHGINDVVSLDSDGFTLGTDTAVNVNAVVGVYLAVRDDGKGDFSTVTYTGDNTDDKLVFSGFQPIFALLKSDSAITGSMKFAGQASALATPTSNISSMQYGGGGDRSEQIGFLGGGLYVSKGNSGNVVNVAATAHYGFAFGSSTNKTLAFNFTGTGTAGFAPAFSSFRPGFVILRNSTGLAPQIQFSSEAANTTQPWDTAAVANSITSLGSNGITVGTLSDANGLGNSIWGFYLYDPAFFVAGGHSLASMGVGA